MTDISSPPPSSSPSAPSIPTDSPPSPTLSPQSCSTLQLASSPADPLLAYLTQNVVLDTPGPLVYIGTLTQVHPDYLVLTQADVHFTTESRTPKDLYVLESKDLGVKVNRQRVIVTRNIIASVSLLADVRDQ